MQGRAFPAPAKRRAVDAGRDAVGVAQQELDMPNRERIDHPKSHSFIRRDERGRFTSDQVEVGRSLAADRRRDAKTIVPKGQGDRGDQRRSSR
jgi:hypothetical protein